MAGSCWCCTPSPGWTPARAWPSSCRRELPPPRPLLNLSPDVQPDFRAPRLQQMLDHRAGAAVADGHPVEPRHGHQTVRRTGRERLVGVDRAVHLEVALDERDADLA